MEEIENYIETNDISCQQMKTIVFLQMSECGVLKLRNEFPFYVASLCLQSKFKSSPCIVGLNANR